MRVDATLLRLIGVAAAAALIVSICSSPLFAQYESDDRRSYTAVRVEQAPQLDGRVVDDPVWQAIEPTSGFTQTAPDEGEPASNRTDVRVVFTDDAIYFGFVLHDPDPSGIVVSDSRRDASLEETDSIQIVLDTYRDEQNGFVFGTNPAGIEYDGQLSNAGVGSSLLTAISTGAGGGFNLNWDGVWEVRTCICEEGWSAEFRIPFTTLRYPSRDEQLWGFNVQRNIRDRNENAYWAPLDRQFNLYRLADAGVLDGIEAEPQRNLQITPYVLGEAAEVGPEGTGTDFEWGVDVKYSLTPALTLDLTYNTDFAQVEVDESQVTLDRFNLFFPEKRPFFLENQGLFTAGKPRQVELFFSRRIGLSPAGDIIPIKGGARVSGAVAGVNVGAMYMLTDALDGVAPENRFGVARINKELPNRSSLGAIIVSREATGSQALPGDDNQTYGIDGRLGIGEYGSIAAYAAKTSTPGLNGKDHSYAVMGSYDSQSWLFNVDYVEVGENFNPEVGFLNRTAYRNALARVLYRYRPKSGRFGIQELRPHISYNSYWDFDGFQETAFLHVDNHIEWKNGYEIHTAVNFTTEGLKQPFEISEGIFVPPGTYRNEELMLVGFTNQGAPLSFNLTVIAGGFYSGDRVSISPSMRWRIGEKFITELSWARNDVDLPEGAFVTDLGRLRLSYSFTPKIALQALIQYNNVDDFWSSNLRFSWLRTASTGLYVVYNDIQGSDRYSGAQPNRSLVVKYTQLFDVF